MRILHTCAEFFPLVKTGGLADVTAALSKAQTAVGVDARILIPAFPAIKAGIKHTDTVLALDTFAGRVALRYGQYQGTGVYLIDAPHLYQRIGSPYHDSHGNAYADNYLRFALLGWFAAELASGMDTRWRAEIVHAHDWHAGLACAYLAAKGSYTAARSVFTVHNLAYQGLFAARYFAELQLPDHFFAMQGLEFHGQVSYLKAGIFYADHITTVSPTYAREILHPDFGHGLEGLLREKVQQQRLTGILNGIDETIWNPETDRMIAQQYSKLCLSKKGNNKQILQKEMGLKVAKERPLFAVVSRLVAQKGLDLVRDALPDIVKRGGQLVILGDGDTDLHQTFTQARESSDYSQHIATFYGYNEELSHRVFAGADVILVPSRFEPCGLTQLYGLKYGTLPLVRHTGGLADTVVDSTAENIKNKIASGFVFYDYHVKALLAAINHVFTLWEQPAVWQTVQKQAMSQNFSWRASAADYLILYKKITR